MLETIALRLHGRTAGEVARLTMATLRQALASRMPAARAAREADRAFDRRWGTDTSDLVTVSELGFSPDRAAQAVHYQPSRIEKLTDPVSVLNLDPRDYDFIDYGAGKGRIVMTAMDMGFASVTGVELSDRLCRIARDNVARFKMLNRHASTAQILCVDATEHHPSGKRILAYFYNPFGAEILAKAVSKLGATATSGAQEVLALYVQPEHLEVFEHAGWAVERLSDEIAVARLAAVGAERA